MNGLASTNPSSANPSAARTRIGLYGGSFDPIHLGHLLVARAAMEEVGLDRLFFIPAAQSPFKPGIQPAPGPLRLAMVRLALAGCPDFFVDDQELRRGGVSFTVDTLRDYARRFPGAEMHCLIGADHAAKLPAWRDPEELARLAQFVVIPRPGEPPGILPAPFQGRLLVGFPLGVSSSRIRERVRAGQPIDWLVPAGVAELIRNNRLYL